MMLTIGILCLLPLGESTRAQEQEREQETLRFLDSDDDGVNDLFRDADGNGINDVTGKEYRHQFSYRDGDGDGNNDLFRDENGDGVNDLAPSNETLQYAIDFDNDGVNDVTGKSYKQKNVDRGFVDEDGDGINDGGFGERTMQGHRRIRDVFTDEDDDGINDGRGFGGERRRKGWHGRGKGGRQGNR